MSQASVRGLHSSYVYWRPLSWCKQGLTTVNIVVKIAANKLIVEESSESVGLYIHVLGPKCHILLVACAWDATEHSISWMLSLKVIRSRCGYCPLLVMLLGLTLSLALVYRVKTERHIKAAAGKFNYRVGGLLGIKSSDRRRGESQWQLWATDTCRKLHVKALIRVKYRVVYRACIIFKLKPSG